MSLAETLARFDATLRPLTMHLPASMSTRLYSSTRKRFLHLYCAERPEAFVPTEEHSQTLWGIRFRAPIFNAAGMFKNGEGYEVVSRQGAGAYLCGTTTAIARSGNIKRGIELPFSPYPRSGAASNWLGLPNRGHEVVASILSRVQKIEGCPVGASVSADPTQSGIDALGALVTGMKNYEEAGVDFMELNESCPNVAVEGHRPSVDELDAGLLDRLRYVSSVYLSQRRRPLPVIVKLSNDTNPDLIPALVELLHDLGFGGINFGNTSTQYAEYRSSIDAAELSQYDYFTSTFGGGLSGRMLKQRSLLLCRIAVEHSRARALRDFHIIRTGGIEDAKDLRESLAAGVALCQWYTGYFDSFALNGHALYRKLLAG